MNRNGWSDGQLMQAMAAAAGCIGADYHATMTALKAAGFVFLGSGCFGAAFTRPDMRGYCIKLSGREVDSYPAYVYWAMANPMPCVPEFRHPVFSESRTQFMVMMPRYAECANELCSSLDYDTASEIVYGYYEHRVEKIEPKTRLQKAASAMRSFFGDTVGWDFHRGNLMWDSVTGTFVITDPMCSGDVDALVTRITGKGTANKTITEQADFDFGMSTQKVWPRPEFADRVDEVEIFAGLGEYTDEARPVKKKQFHVWEGFDFNMLDLAHLEECNAAKAVPPVFVNGKPITKGLAEKVGEYLQCVDIEAADMRGQHEIVVNFAPTIPPFLKINDDVIQDLPMAIRRVALMIDQAKLMKAEWKKQRNVKARQSWKRRNFAQAYGGKNV